MAIKVKVLNDEPVPEVKEEDKPEILTSEYVQEVNRGISYRIRQSQIARAQAEAEVQADMRRFI